jgi:16S rRNA (cytosine1402-N4)-methyltransferase
MFEGEPEKDIYGKSPDLPLKIITKKPITSTDQELITNPRARSAKMRVAEKA